MPLARSITRRLGFRRGNAPEPSLASDFKQISLPLNLVTSPRLFDDLMDGDALTILDTIKSSDSASTQTPRKAGTIASTEVDPESPTTPSLTDASSIENSPTDERGFLSATFPDVVPLTPQGLLSTSNTPPAIPKRVPSHSKKEHVRLARNRSLRASEAPANDSSASPSKGTWATASTLLADPLLEVDEDARFDVAYMRQHDLGWFTAADYQAVMPSLTPWTDDTAQSSCSDIPAWI